MYQVLARKWRPRNFGELIGQGHVARALTNAIEADRLAHAYIFAGLRGTGKTTVARILAKCMNCEQGPATEPCDECTSCREIAEGRSIDVLEMDAASRTGVDNIRELQEMVSYAPVRDRYKVLIIDEAHMLSKAAFNALLKTLEEPPPNVLFVLATTEMQKVLPTILSRCQVFEFRRVTPGELAGHLRRLCDEEQIEISDAMLERISRAGEGSVRDSLSVLERVVAFTGQQVDEEEALKVLGAVRLDILVRMIGGLAARDASAMLAVLDELADEGHDLVHFWGELIAVLRDLLLVRSLDRAEGVLSRSEDETRSLIDAGQELSREDLLRAFQIVAELEYGLKASGQPRFLFEAALIRLAALDRLQPLEQVLAALGATPASHAAPRRAAPAKEKKSLNETPAAATPESVPFYGTFVDLLREKKPMWAAMLQEHARPALDGRRLTLTFDTGGAAFRQRLADEKANATLLELLEKAAGFPVTLRLAEEAAGAASTPRAAEPAREAPEGPLAPAPAAAPPKRRDRKALLERAESEPGIKKLLHEFGARVVDIRELGEAAGEQEEPGEEPK